MINVFYRDDFENSGEKNKRGSVIWTFYRRLVGVSTFLCNGKGADDAKKKLKEKC
jgi:hypothetical protein